MSEYIINPAENINKQQTKLHPNPILWDRFQWDASKHLYWFRKKFLSFQKWLINPLSVDWKWLELWCWIWIKAKIIPFHWDLTVLENNSNALLLFEKLYREQLEPKNKLSYKISKFIEWDALFIDKIFNNEKFDLIFSIAFIHHIEDQRSLIEQCYNKLENGWKLVFIDHFQYKNIIEDYRQNRYMTALIKTFAQCIRQFQKHWIPIHESSFDIWEIYKHRQTINEFFDKNKIRNDFFLNLLLNFLWQRQKSIEYIDKCKEDLWWPDESIIKHFFEIYSLLFSMWLYNLTPIEDFENIMKSIFWNDNVRITRSSILKTLYTVEWVKN